MVNAQYQKGKGKGAGRGYKRRAVTVQQVFSFSGPEDPINQTADHAAEKQLNAA
jgi:hypothetical protein